jgi:hypothetical protein
MSESQEFGGPVNRPAHNARQVTPGEAQESFQPTGGGLDFLGLNEQVQPQYAVQPAVPAPQAQAPAPQPESWLMEMPEAASIDLSPHEELQPYAPAPTPSATATSLLNASWREEPAPARRTRWMAPIAGGAALVVLGMIGLPMLRKTEPTPAPAASTTTARAPAPKASEPAAAFPTSDPVAAADEAPSDLVTPLAPVEPDPKLDRERPAKGARRNAQLALETGRSEAPVNAPPPGASFVPPPVDVIDPSGVWQVTPADDDVDTGGEASFDAQAADDGAAAGPSTSARTSEAASAPKSLLAAQIEADDCPPVVEREVQGPDAVAVDWDRLIWIARNEAESAKPADGASASEEPKPRAGKKRGRGKSAPQDEGISRSLAAWAGTDTPESTDATTNATTDATTIEAPSTAPEAAATEVVSTESASPATEVAALETAKPETASEAAPGVPPVATEQLPTAPVSTEPVSTGAVGESWTSTSVAATTSAPVPAAPPVTDPVGAPSVDPIAAAQSSTAPAPLAVAEVAPTGLDPAAESSALEESTEGPRVKVLGRGSRRALREDGGKDGGKRRARRENGELDVADLATGDKGAMENDVSQLTVSEAPAPAPMSSESSAGAPDASAGATVGAAVAQNADGAPAAAIPTPAATMPVASASTAPSAPLTTPTSSDSSGVPSADSPTPAAVPTAPSSDAVAAPTLPANAPQGDAQTPVTGETPAVGAAPQVASTDKHAVSSDKPATTEAAASPAAGAAQAPAEAAPTRALQVATEADLKRIRNGQDVPLDALAAKVRIATPEVGKARVVFHSGEIFEGELVAVGEGCLWLRGKHGTLGLDGARVKSAVRLAPGDAPVLGAPGSQSLAGLPRARVKTPGGPLFGKIVERDENHTTLITDSGARVVLDSRAVEVLTEEPKVQIRP